MEQTKVKKIVVEKEPIKTEEKKKSVTIFGIKIWRILAYFILYSIVGFIIETAFGLITKGVLESRQSFLYGPFCAIYGVGAVIMIVGLQSFKKNRYTLFAGGFLIGSIVEYFISLIGEFVFHIKWWDYSDMAFNINGRVCIAFSFFWGILAIYLMSHFNPIMDRWIDKIEEKLPKGAWKAFLITGILLLFIDFLVTSFALKMFFTRLVGNYQLELQNSEEYFFECAQLYQDQGIRDFTLKYFSDEKMLKTFPNIKVVSKEGEIIWVKDIITHIQPYYFRLFTPRHAQN